MANTYYQIYIQIVFAVQYRNALLEETWRPELFAVIGNLINETGCKTIIISGVEDHIHCLLALKPTVTISDLTKTIKAKSSKYINENQLTKIKFSWQNGYGVFSYSQSQLDNVYKYIENQKEHHKKQNFNDEYLNFLNKFNIEYEEKYTFEALM
ncbi:IS200/IS605 family transposase [Flavobacterium hercynium]|uniref:Transposase n=1 Tax=Flavobacterium hercynium TaxID=387094 RepID=A0A226HKJ4_9FLAO|nr:IS200/IS605 family transposase [Flavobacterium hercynium]OXA94797.1 transposase [Flavobacterium hercynium]SMP07992.1 REP element-mobilizing transposase RayT [Flavobacterium hercynium]